MFDTAGNMESTEKSVINITVKRQRLVWRDPVTTVTNGLSQKLRDSLKQTATHYSVFHPKMPTPCYF